VSCDEPELGPSPYRYPRFLRFRCPFALACLVYESTSPAFQSVPSTSFSIQLHDSSPKTAMAAALPPGEVHDIFLKWATDHGIEMNGVAPAKFVGRGMGIVAARDLKVCYIQGFSYTWFTMLNLQERRKTRFRACQDSDINRLRCSPKAQPPE